MTCDYCGGPLTGRQRRFCSSRCRSRHRRRGPQPDATAVETTATNPAGKRLEPDTPPGRVRAALDRWLTEEGLLPSPLSAAAEKMADQLDTATVPDPALWNAYVRTVRALIEASGGNETTSRPIMEEIREDRQAPR